MEQVVRLSQDANAWGVKDCSRLGKHSYILRSRILMKAGKSGRSFVVDRASWGVVDALLSSCSATYFDLS